MQFKIYSILLKTSRGVSPREFWAVLVLTIIAGSHIALKYIGRFEKKST